MISAACILSDSAVTIYHVLKSTHFTHGPTLISTSPDHKNRNDRLFTALREQQEFNKMNNVLNKISSK